MFSLMLSLAASAAAQSENKLVWELSVKGAPVGTREVTVRTMHGTAEGEDGSRVLESFTDLSGQVGPMRVRWRQRLTAHIDAREPASFTSVVDQNGTTLEIQGRWTPDNWIVTTTTNGRPRTTEMPLARVDISTADLLDPATRYPFAHFTELRILSAESGEVLTGPVERLGVSEVTVQGTPIQVTGYAWTSTKGRSEFKFSADGFLVAYRTQLFGVDLEAVLRDPPPGGSDDFPVSARGARVDAVDL
jgi:hypothetical protein